MRAKRFPEEQLIGVLGVQSWREDQGTLQAIWDIEGRHPPANFIDYAVARHHWASLRSANLTT
jgi:hypothetical protein